MWDRPAIAWAAREVSRGAGEGERPERNVVACYMGSSGRGALWDLGVEVGAEDGEGQAGRGEGGWGGGHEVTEK